MKIRQTLMSSAIAIGSLLITQFANAQSLTQKSSTITVKGTSTLHDWVMKANSSTFTGTVSGNAITNIKLTIPYNNLKSEKGNTMDKKAYKALKESNIFFTTSSIPVGSSNVNGQLTIAGVTKNVSLPVNVIKKGNIYTITGEETIKMSDYKMERPGMLGIKTGDVVTVNVSITAQ